MPDAYRSRVLFASQILGEPSVSPQAVDLITRHLLFSQKPDEISRGIADLRHTHAQEDDAVGIFSAAQSATWKFSSTGRICLDMSGIQAIRTPRSVSESWKELFDTSAGVGQHEEIVLRIGTGHGILYQPLPGVGRTNAAVGAPGKLSISLVE